MMEAIKNQVSEVFALQRTHFLSTQKMESIAERKKRLRKLKKWILNNEEAICTAIYNDFKKPPFEVRISEIFPVVSAIRHALKCLDDWTATKTMSGGMGYLFTKGKLRMEPKGVSLIISPWNYPFMLAIEPTVSAIAAGCTVMVKPSEDTPHTSDLIKRLAAEIFEKKEFEVFLGDYRVSQELLKMPFNHIFFTGSPRVGKIVMKAAADHLTSVTLELGGMNPAIVDESADLKDAAEKILWAKTMNAAQTCVSINEIFIQESVQEKFIKKLHQAEKKLYPFGFVQGESMAVLVNENHYKRVKKLLKDAELAGGKIVYGGVYKDEDRWISPTVIANVPSESEIRNEEIFAPVVVLSPYKKLDSVISKLSNRPVPLSAYIFTKNARNRKRFLDCIQAGTTCVNDTTIQFAHPELPFGGHNNSGIGKAHGYYGFLEFVNQRSELHQRRGFTTAKLIYPPYDKKWKQQIVKAFVKWF